MLSTGARGMKVWVSGFLMSSLMSSLWSCLLLISLADHPVELHGLSALSAAVVAGLGLLGVDGLAVTDQTVLVSLAGEIHGPVLALGDVLGLHHLVVSLALALLGLQHSSLVLVGHVLGQLGHVVGVLALTLDTLLHGGPVVLALALTVLLLVPVPEPRVPPLVLAVVHLGALVGLLDLEGGNERLLEVDGPLGLLGGDLHSGELALLHAELHRGLHVLLVLGGQGSAGLHLDVPPVLGLLRGAAEMIVESSKLDVLHHDLVGVLGGGLHDDLPLQAHSGEG